MEENRVSSVSGGCVGWAIIGALVFWNLWKGIWMGVLFILCGLAALVGVIPIAGQFFLYKLLYNHIIPGWSSYSGISGHWMVTVTNGNSCIHW